MRRKWDTEGQTAAYRMSLRDAVAAALDSPDARVRTAAAASLGDLELGAAPRLVRALKDPASTVRAAALRALVAERGQFEVGELGPAQWWPSFDYRLPPILPLLDDPESAVRAAALAGVAAYWYGARHEVRERVTWDRIIGFTRDADPSVRREATVLLMEDARSNGNWRAAEVVFRRGLRDVDPGVRAESARWFGWSLNRLEPDEEALLVATLRELLGAQDPAVRWSAAWSLWRRTHDPAGLAPILSERVAEGGDEALEAVRMLHEIGPAAKEAAPALVQVLGYGVGGMQQGLGAYAADALFDLGPEAEPFLAPLAAALRSPSRDRRRDAAWALAALHGQAPKRAAMLTAARARESDRYVLDAFDDALCVVAPENGRLEGLLASSFFRDADVDAARGLVRTALSAGAGAASFEPGLMEAADAGHAWTTRHSVSTPGRAPFRVDLRLTRDAIDAIGACGPAAREALPGLRRLRADARLTKHADAAIARIER